MVGTTRENPAPGPLLLLREKLVCTPLRHSEFERELALHPDKAWVSWLLNGMSNGMSIGFVGPHTPYLSSNLPSASRHPQVITTELEKEVAAGRVLGPFVKIPHGVIQGLWAGCHPHEEREVEDDTPSVRPIRRERQRWY